MTAFDSTLIKAFFNESDIKAAQQLSAQSPLASTAAGVYRTTVDGNDVQVDGFTFPGCTSCGCEAFRQRRSCAHTCFGVAAMLAEHPNLAEMLWPDSRAAIDPNLLQPDCYYELKMLPMTYSPSCQGGSTFAETVLDLAQRCRGAVDDELIAKKVKRLFDDYFEQSDIWGLDIRESEINGLIALLSSLGISDTEIRALVSQYPEHSALVSPRWWPWHWWAAILLPSSWRYWPL